MDVTAACWHCADFVGQSDFCESCGKIQPFAESSNYFRFLGYDVILQIEPDELEQRYYTLSRKFHPDYFHNTTDEEKEIALSKSAYLTRAYKTLQDPFTRADYLLQLLGKKDPRNKNIVPPEILMEVSELHEKLDAFQHAAPQEKERLAAALESDIRGLKSQVKNLKTELLDLFPRWDNTHAVDLPETAGLLQRMEQILAIRSYLRTLIRTLRETISNGNT